MTENAIVLLAAGQSRRMGGANKLLMPFNSEPLIRYSAKLYTSLPNSRVYVVLGHQAEQIIEVLENLDVDFVFNDSYKEGQRSSVYCGLSASQTAEKYLVAPADLPRLTKNDCHNLIHSHREKPEGSITIPICREQSGMRRGNPIVLSSQARETVVSGGINLGCRGLIDRQPELINIYLTKSEGFFFDIDTPEAYRIENNKVNNSRFNLQ
mgnify:CR=1 FL=1